MTKILATQVNPGELAIFWLGQNSYILKTSEGTLIAIDPYFSRTPRFQYIHADPPIRSEDLYVDYVFCTHDHLDHTDPLTLSLMAKHSLNTTFFGSKESYDRCVNVGIDPARVQSLTANETRSLRDFQVTALYSIPPRNGVTTHFGYVFAFQGVTLYVMGDSDASVVERPLTVLRHVIPFAPEIAIFPIIGDFPDRRPEDAVKFTSILRPKIVIPCHYDCFADRTIDPTHFVTLLQQAHLTDVQPVVIAYKGQYIYRS